MRDALRAGLLSPVLIPQIAWVRLRAARLQEPPGARAGVAGQGQGQGLRLLIIGDSSGAGVGADHQDQALSGRLVAHLADTHRVTWQLEARCGATTTTKLAHLGTLPEAQFDVAVIALGVNDSKNGMSRALWQANYRALIDLLVTRFGVQRIFACGVPNLGQFPALPRPLNAILGARATAFDADLHAMVAGDPRLCYVPMTFDMDPGLMARDGFHPGPQIYDAWAARVAALIKKE